MKKNNTCTLSMSLEQKRNITIQVRCEALKCAGHCIMFLISILTLHYKNEINFNFTLKIHSMDPSLGLSFCFSKNWW